ncbi:Methylthioribose-1-phosphate isomerase [Aphelenchoides besseyi]|nr:Methylthioribose-1-phosphate isomerase [Aphelenchoides besseyi]KAI6229500.1 Methylthioribose-1-phosphate isomerase [Aphelenchoides besseyi]
MSEEFEGFEFEAIQFDPTKIEWEDLSRRELKFETLRYDKTSKTLEVLDQLLLPTTTEYISVRNVQDAHRVIREMNVRGAPLIATVGLLGLSVDLEHNPEAKAENLVDYIDRACDYLKTSRPTAVNLTNEVLKLRDFTAKLSSLSDDEIRKQLSSETIHDYVYRLYVSEREENDLLLRHAVACVEHNVADRKTPLNVITICNTGALATSSFGTALGNSVIRALHWRQRIETAFCLETRPYNQGARLTAYELDAEGIPHCLISDSMAAALMKSRRIHAILVGADQVAMNGDTANKIGTYSLAVLANYHRIPFYVVTPTSSINPRIQSGNEITIEERKADEFKIFNGIQIAPSNTPVWNPAFDITPAQLITAILTERGNVRPANVKNLF